jgi:thiol:disulfide interchange protein DsbD
VMFFVLSLGLGLPYLFLALSSGAISRLPRAGVWMVEIKKIFGFVLLGMAAYFARILAPEPVKSWMLPGVLAVGGFYVLTRAFAAKSPGLARVVNGAAGLLFLAAAVFFSPRPNAEGAKAGPRFAAYDAATVAAAGKPAMIDFSADWCIPCHELDDQTFADPRVRKALSGLALYKADMTRQNSPEAQALAKKFQILGMPTIVFLDAKGNEIPGSRLVGFEGPDQFLKRLARLKD